MTGSGCFISASRASALSKICANARGSYTFLVKYLEPFSKIPRQTSHRLDSNSARICMACPRQMSRLIVQSSVFFKYRLYNDLT